MGGFAAAGQYPKFGSLSHALSGLRAGARDRAAGGFLRGLGRGPGLSPDYERGGGFGGAYPLRHSSARSPGGSTGWRIRGPRRGLGLDSCSGGDAAAVAQAVVGVGTADGLGTWLHRL